MKSSSASALLLLAGAVSALPRPDVDDRFPYTGPEIPVGDWVDPTVNGNGKGFTRLVEPPAVKPASHKPTNNINVVSTSYVPNGINIHFQTPFGLGVAPSVRWGLLPELLFFYAAGQTRTYDRTPPCSEVMVTQCSQFYHDIQITDLLPGVTYYYQINAANGTTPSQVLSFTTAREAGDPRGFTMVALNDMGYTNAAGTYEQLVQAVEEEGVAFAWHGGDISYADDWFSGVLPCADDWSVCYNGTGSSLPPGDFPASYDEPLPAGEVANQGGPLGGDMNVIYESNWDLWQQWMNNVTLKIPYMVMPGNHEASCAEFDGPGNVITTYLNEDKANTTTAASNLTYYSCPPSQRNFTAYINRFRMGGQETGGVGNFWYSFDYGLAHFVSLDGETDYPDSPEWPFLRDNADGLPTPGQTEVTDSGPFGEIEGNEINNVEAYAQYKWLVEDLKSVDRARTPWVIAMSHRPMYSSQTASYQKAIRNAFEAVFLQYGVDLYLSGHIHWYERTWPLGANGTIDSASIVDNNTYYANEGKSITHIINGMAGNIESHSTLGDDPILDITNVLDQEHYGFSKLSVVSDTKLTWQFVRGDGAGIGDALTLLRKPSTPSWPF